MICRTCLRRASSAARLAARLVTRPSPRRNAVRKFSISAISRSADERQTFSAPLPGSASAAQSPAGGSALAAASSCPPGTVLAGLNYFKGREDPVALPDDEYPDWLWTCLESGREDSEPGEAGTGDEFCTASCPAPV